ncbi:ABC transporter permease [Tepidanaerobacter syntrophicus]|uniref:ABC transporter permease n=1 Tax=Tepidanaerobacter syntrophicus TaxID=224999 RepID=UPI001BD2B8DF|nr:ABC transporter permease [Tepidanaerobacter syntrophicus]
MLSKILKNHSIIIGSIILITILLIAIFAPYLTPYKYDVIDLTAKKLPPSLKHLMGTDEFGRDVWTRVVYGSRISLTISLGAVVIAVLIGCTLGLLAGYFKGPFDFILGRLMDIMMSFPAILLSLLIGVALGTSIINMCITIGIPWIPTFYRITRSAALNVGERYFVLAAKSMGSSDFRIISKHIFPNTLSQIFVLISFSMGGSITAEAALGYLGLGIPAPTPSWGVVISEGKRFIFDAPWIAGFSGGMIALTILAFNLLGDGLRDILDPKLAS